MFARLRQVVLAGLSRLQPPAELKHPLPVALTSVAAAIAMRFAVDPILRDHSPFLFFAIAVVLAALYGGAWAGIIAIVVSIPVSDYFFVEPRHTWFIYDATADSLMLVLFALLGAVTTLIIDRLHQNRKRLRQSLADLQRSEFRLELTTATIPEIIFSARDSGSADYINGYLARFCGNDPASLLGNGWIEAIHPDDRNLLLEKFSSRLEIGDEFQATLRLRRADGAYRFFKCHAKRIVDPEDQENKWFGVLSDIDNERALTATLESRTQELMGLNEALERFAHTASHDLQEPLRTIGGMTELFLSQSGKDLDKHSAEMLTMVVKAIGRMKRLIHDLMELATMTHVSRQLKSEVNTRAVAELAIANLGQAIHESGAEIVVDPLPSVHANETAMLRLFQNLIANAIKYRADRPPEIRISAALRDEAWIFSVKDNGIGIAPEYRDNIFEPFRRLHGRAEYEGSGLGLTACRRIVHSLNGTIWVESGKGEGSTFFFSIPSGQSGPHRKAAGSASGQNSSHTAARAAKSSTR